MTSAALDSDDIIADDHSDEATKDMVEVVRLLERLRAASPHKVRAVRRMLEGIVEGEEMIADLDHQLMLRRRPTKRYRA